MCYFVAIDFAEGVAIFVKEARIIIFIESWRDQEHQQSYVSGYTVGRISF
jgi:hypothetical protein